MDDATVVGKLIMLGKGFSRWVRIGLDNLINLGMESPESTITKEKTEPTPKPHVPEKTAARSTQTTVSQAPTSNKSKPASPNQTKRPAKTSKPKPRSQKKTATKSRQQIMEEIYKILQSNPTGVSASELATQIGVKPQALPHPLKTLVKEKGVVKAGNYYFPNKKAAEKSEAQIKIKRGGLKDPELDKKIVSIVEKSPGISLTDIAAKLNKTRQGIAKASKRLQDGGILEKRGNLYYPK